GWASRCIGCIEGESLSFILATGWSLHREKWSDMMEPRRSLLPPDGLHRRNLTAEHDKGESPMAVCEKKATQKATKASTKFTNEERDAMKERVQELKTEKVDGESLVLAKIGEMPAPDRALGERLHAIIKASAPALSPKLWYGMPAYAR